LNILFLPESYHISIPDGDADTCVLGKEWEVLFVHNSRKSNVVCFDDETAIERNLDLPNGLDNLCYWSCMREFRTKIKKFINIDRNYIQESLE
jgi:hypothetical protein